MQARIDKEAVASSELRRTAWFRRLAGHIPREQFGRYLFSGVWNTLFGYGAYAALTSVLAPFVSHSYIPASIIAAPLNITVSYLSYKWFVFRTRGNYLHEWTRCFIVYGSAMVMGIILLPPIVLLVRLLTGLDRPAPYIAGALLMGFNVIYGFLGHKNLLLPPSRLITRNQNTESASRRFRQTLFRNGWNLQQLWYTEVAKARRQRKLAENGIYSFRYSGRRRRIPAICAVRVCPRLYVRVADKRI